MNSDSKSSDIETFKSLNENSSNSSLIQYESLILRYSRSFLNTSGFIFTR